MLKFKYLIITVLTLIVVSSCSQRPKGVLSDDEMVELLADMQLAEAMKFSLGVLPDSLRDCVGDRILQEHNVSRAELDSSMLWYASNIDRFQKLYKDVNVELQRKSKKLGGETTQILNKDQNLWPFSPHVMFLPQADTESLIFSVPGGNIDKGSKIEWKMRVNTQAELEQMLGVDYKDGSSEFLRRTSYGDRNIKISLQTDTSRIVSRVYGVASAKRSVMPIWADSISVVKLPYDSMSYRNRPHQEHLRPH